MLHPMYRPCAKNPDPLLFHYILIVKKTNCMKIPRYELSWYMVFSCNSFVSRVDCVVKEALVLWYTRSHSYTWSLHHLVLCIKHFKQKFIAHIEYTSWPRAIWPPRFTASYSYWYKDCCGTTICLKSAATLSTRMRTFSTHKHELQLTCTCVSL